MAERFPDWRRRLARFVRERRQVPHVWGASDCALTAADAALAQTGVDYAAPLRGYASRFGAARALVKLGHASVVSFLDAILTRTERPRAGDFIVDPDPPCDRVGIADGRGAVWTQGPDGLVRVAIPANALAWSV